MGKQDELKTECLDTGVADGRAFIETASPLNRLHYFDGRFLRADDLAQEQAYHRLRLQLANQAGGWGVVHGLDFEVDGDQITVLPGMGVTAAGEFVMAVGEVSARVADLLAVAQPAPTTGSAGFEPCVSGQTTTTTTVGDGLVVYELTVGPIDALCGNEPVHGKLCESACVSDSRHSSIVEGLVMRLRPIALPLPNSPLYGSVHLRNRVASAYFERERQAVPHLLSPQGLRGPVWCGPAQIGTRNELVLGVLVREGQSMKSIDMWTGRRERMEAQARAYWQGRMAMRPWNVFLAQILQFQCQLSNGLGDDVDLGAPVDPCDDLREALERTRREIRALNKHYADSARAMAERLGARVTKSDATWMVNEAKASAANLQAIESALSQLNLNSGKQNPARWLLAKGFGELPPAGYLPIAATQSVPEQLARWFGEGVRVHLRAAPFDALPHLLEEAQHMNRISLTKGIDNPQALEDVEVFVPDGAVGTVAAAPQGTWWQTQLHVPAVMGLALASAALGDDKASEVSAEEAAPVTEGMPSQPAPIEMRMTRLEKPQSMLAGATLTSGSSRTLPEGLSRTDLDATAGHRLTMVLGGRDDEEAADETEAQPADDIGTAPPLTHREMAKSSVIYTTSSTAMEAAYVAGDVHDDPMSLSVGQSTPIAMEVAILAGSKTPVLLVLRSQGTMTVLTRTTRAQRTIARVQIDLDQQMIMSAAGQSQTKRTSVRRTMMLSRQGTEREGVLRLDDADQNPKTPPIDVVWDDLPRQAVVGVDWQSLVDQANDEATAKLIAAAMAKLDATPADGRLELVTLNALSGMPVASSGLATRALNAITQLSEAMDDAAFFHRARQRLLPTAQAGATVAVRAVHDWVMFRRARPHFCDPVCTAPVPESLTEAFQVLHLRLKSVDQMIAFKEAVKSAGDAVWAQFPPKLVGVLRYLDDNTTPEETAGDVRAMWAASNPGNTVVLGRAWERTPQTGQGWQNRARLNDMLRTLQGMVKLPAAGSSVLGTLNKAPTPLDDPSLDGGMLLVTLDVIETQAVNHRVVMMRMDAYQRFLGGMRQQPDEAWKELADFLEKAHEAEGAVTNVVERIPDRMVQFSHAVLKATDQTLLQQDKAFMTSVPSDMGYGFQAYRVDARAPLASGVQPAAQHQALCTLLGVSNMAPPSGGNDGVFQASVSDFGSGAQVLTVVGVLRLEPN